jgi:hypothetical protein
MTWISKARVLPFIGLVSLVGCTDGDPASPAEESSVHAILGGLGPGESLVLTGADTRKLFLAGGGSGAEYIVVPFHGARLTDSRLALEFVGDGVSGSGPSATVAAALEPAGPLVGQALDTRGADAHMRFRERSMREARALLRAEGGAAGEDRVRLQRHAATLALDVPAVGDLLTLNVQSEEPCFNPEYRTGRVVAVGERAIIVADTLNPEGGFEAEDYEAFLRVFDRRIHFVLTRYFGQPTDVDGNGRVIIFFTSAVNDLSAPGSGSLVGGFFYARDLFPQTPTGGLAGCPGSNHAEIFYLLVPDPSREAQEPWFSRESVAATIPGVIGHEYAHLINAGRRIYVNGANDYEEIWLDEALAHIAEELLFYDEAQLEPGGNLNYSAVAATQRRVDAANRYLIGNLGRYRTLLAQPEASTIFEFDLAGRGASWSFLRYLIDHSEEDDEALIRRLANSVVSGLDNLEAVFGGGILDRARDWAVSVYLDDALPNVLDRYTQPSWNFRSIITTLYGANEFPLQVRSLEPVLTERLSLKGGGAGFVRVRLEPAARAELNTTSDGAVPPDGLHLTVVRTR